MPTNSLTCVIMINNVGKQEIPVMVWGGEDREGGESGRGGEGKGIGQERREGHWLMVYPWLCSSVCVPVGMVIGVDACSIYTVSSLALSPHFPCQIHLYILFPSLYSPSLLSPPLPSLPPPDWEHHLFVVGSFCVVWLQELPCRRWAAMQCDLPPSVETNESTQPDWTWTSPPYGKQTTPKQYHLSSPWQQATWQQIALELVPLFPWQQNITSHAWSHCTWVQGRNHNAQVQGLGREATGDDGMV